VLSLTGLSGVGSIPVATLCVVGLLMCAITLMAQYLLLKTTDQKEHRMKHTEKKSTQSSRLWNAILLTITAVGTEVGSGLALLG